MTQLSVALRCLFFSLLMLMLLAITGDLQAESSLRPYDGRFAIEPEMTQMMHFDGLERVDIGNPDIVGVSTKAGQAIF